MKCKLSKLHWKYVAFALHWGQALFPIRYWIFPLVLLHHLLSNFCINHVQLMVFLIPIWINLSTTYNGKKIKIERKLLTIFYKQIFKYFSSIENNQFMGQLRNINLCCHKINNCIQYKNTWSSTDKQLFCYNFSYLIFVILTRVVKRAWSFK